MLPMVLTLVDQIVRQNEQFAKKKLYALAMSYVFSVELGPPAGLKWPQPCLTTPPHLPPWTV